jgi:hypothetical protein
MTYTQKKITYGIFALAASAADELAAQGRTLDIVDGAFVVTEIPVPQPEPEPEPEPNSPTAPAVATE